jgi:hypothetical protein
MADKNIVSHVYSAPGLRNPKVAGFYHHPGIRKDSNLWRQIGFEAGSETDADTSADSQADEKDAVAGKNGLPVNGHLE